MIYESKLYHYGIPNMEWGKKNGPPYPLSESQKSAAEKRGKKKEPQKYGLRKPNPKSPQQNGLRKLEPKKSVFVPDNLSPKKKSVFVPDNLSPKKKDDSIFKLITPKEKKKEPQQNGLRKLEPKNNISPKKDGLIKLEPNDRSKPQQNGLRKLDPNDLSELQKNGLRKLGGIAGSVAAGAAAWQVANKVTRPLADIAISKLAPDATKEEHDAMSAGLAAIGNLSVSMIASRQGTKAGEAFVNRCIIPPRPDLNDRRVNYKTFEKR